MNKTWTGTILKENAKKLLKKNYWLCVGAALIVLLLGNGAASGLGTGGYNAASSMADIREVQELNQDPDADTTDTALPDVITPTIVVTAILSGMLLRIFLFNVIEVGGNRFFILNRKQTPSVGVVFDGFQRGRYMNIVKTMFFRDLYICLWTLLFLIPGIVKTYEYLMVAYILADNPTMKCSDVLHLSKQMMHGNKGDAFILSLSFLGWDILSMLTCGLVGIFYVNPYCMATFTELYAYNKEEAF